jgi:preprotein translocase subunit SecE
MFGKIGSFFGESKQELAKVNWPTRRELADSTLLVIVVTLIIAAFIFVVDLVLSFVMRVVLG